MKKAAKVFLSLFLTMTFVFCVSLLWRALLLVVLLAVWKKQAKEFFGRYWSTGYHVLWTLLWAAVVCGLPRYVPLPSDRVRLYYAEDGKIVLPPLSHWIVNAVIPEEELCNIGIATASVSGPIMGAGGGIMKDFNHDSRAGKIGNFTVPYSRLTWELESPMSGAYAQGGNQYAGDCTTSFYLIRPKGYDSRVEYPLVVFCHGYLGNWKLYTGILKDLKGCITMCIGTRNLSGLFNAADIDRIHTYYIPLLEREGYRIDKSQVSLLGLSNGGTATDAAYSKYPERFRNLVYISTGVNHTHRVIPKILIIGGGRDHCAQSMRQGYEAIRRNGGEVRQFWDDDETHFILVNKRKEIVDFLNAEL